jgi:hypothetical protein
MDESESFHAMTYAEREELKHFALRGECLADTLLMITHWMRQTQDITFTGYASNWAAANRDRGIEAMRRQWPLAGQQLIADRSSEWGSSL